MKYVIMSRDHCGLSQQVPIIFHNFLCRSDVAAAVARIPDMKSAVATSAGFLASVDIDSEPVGKSATLKLGSGENDGMVIKMHDYLQGL